MCASSAVIALRPTMISLYRLSNCRARAPSYSSHRLLREPIAALGDLEQEGLRPRRPQSLCQTAGAFNEAAPPFPRTDTGTAVASHISVRNLGPLKRL